MATKTKDEYEYIGTFIDYLERIIDLIIKLFSGIGGGKVEASTAENNG